MIHRLFGRVAVAMFSLAFIGQLPVKGQQVGVAVKPPIHNDLLESVQLIASVDKKDFEPSQRILLNLTLANKGQHSLRVLQDESNQLGFDIVVKNERGTKMPFTRFGAIQVGEGAERLTRATPIELDAGQKIQVTIDLNRVVDMSEEGNYLVTAKRYLEATKGDKPIEVVSNTTTIQIYNPAPFTTLPLENSDQEAQEQRIDNFDWTKVPTTAWQLGDSWNLSIELLLNNPPDTLAPLLQGLPQEDRKRYEEAVRKAPRGPALLGRYRVMAQVNGSEKVNNRDCWQVVFLPDIKSPGNVQYSRPCILVDKETGQTLRMDNLDKGNTLRVERLSSLSFPVETQLGYPLPFLPTDEDLNVNSANGYHLTISQQTTGAGRVSEGQLEADGKERFHIRQRWLPGAKWWNEFELHDNVQGVTLRARRIQ